MTALGDRLRTLAARLDVQASIASRAGQAADLEMLANDARACAAEADKDVLGDPELSIVPRSELQTMWGAITRVRELCDEREAQMRERRPDWPEGRIHTASLVTTGDVRAALDDKPEADRG